MNNQHNTSEREIHDKIQKALDDARKTPQYAEEGRELTKPTGEWTAVTVNSFMSGLESQTKNPYRVIADAHNAALAEAAPKPTGERVKAWLKDGKHTTGEHHPSCVANDMDLVWHCVQCGLNESAADIEEQLAQAYNAGMVAVQKELDRANAALAAEKKRAADDYMELCDKSNGDMIALNKQLAEAAPKLRQNLWDVCVERDNAQAAYRNELLAHARTEKQLAAAEKDGVTLGIAVNELREQLAAEREMSDQPEPAGECHHDLAERETMCADGWCPICLQTALYDANKQLAAERERTAELVDQETRRCHENWSKQLAAEREKRADWNVVIEDLERALAAERKKLTQLHDEWWERVQDLNKQLAAERESRDGFRRALEQRISEVDQLREQLAAVTEAAREVIDGWDGSGRMEPRIDKLRESIGEGK